jgi:sorbitol-specific phosphotransferase system component IIBC
MSWSADCLDCAGAAVFGLRPRLGLQTVNVVKISMVNGDYRRSLECRSTQSIRRQK